MEKPKMSVEKQAVDAETFLYKINKPEGFCILIDDYTAGRFELHVYRPRDMVIYVSPDVYGMGSEAASSFTQAVELAAAVPLSHLKRYQW